MLVHERLKLSHHRHSGRYRPHEYTSYAPLFCLLLVVGVLLAVCSASALSDPPPQSGSVGLNGTMPAAAPTVAAHLTSPNDQQHFSASPITIAGTCPAGTLVEIYKNSIFAGSGACSDKETFSLSADLLIGRNTLTAKVYDALNQPGPDSNSIVVFYDALPAQAGSLTPLNFSGAQLLLNTDAVYRGNFPEQPLDIPISILGGIPPYAVNVQWDDASNDVISRNDNLTFQVAHTYHKAGTFQITVQASDSQAHVAFLTVAAIINGQPNLLASGATSQTSTNKLLVLWPLYTSAIAVVASFWMGERREKRILRPLGLAPHPQQ